MAYLCSVGELIMALPNKIDLNEDTGPVSEEVFQELTGTSPPNAVDIAASLPEAQRAALAVFCYRKRHLHALGLMIASTCSCAALVQAAGTGGEVIFNQSRDPEATLAKENLPSSHVAPKPITLANCAQVSLDYSDIDDEDDDDEDFDD